MAHIFHYSLIRVVPDPRRGEWANVGVCVYLPDRIEVRISDDQRKLRAMAPTLSLGFLSNIAEEWEYLCQGIESYALRQKLLSRMQLVHASGLAWFQCEGDEYEDQVDSLMQDLVVPRPMKRAEREPRLKGAIKKMLKRAEMFSDDPNAIHYHKVVANFPIKQEANLYADFAAQNGVLHVTETIDFRVSEDKLRQRHQLAAVKAVTLHAAQQKHYDCKRLIIYAAHEKDRRSIEPALNMLHDYSGEVFDAGDRNDLARYISMTAVALGLESSSLFYRPN